MYAVMARRILPNALVSTSTLLVTIGEAVRDAFDP